MYSAARYGSQITAHAGSPWPKSSWGWQSMMTWDQGPHHLRDAAPAWGALPKQLQTKYHTNQDPQLEISRNENFWVKKNLGNPSIGLALCRRAAMNCRGQDGGTAPGPAQPQPHQNSTHRDKLNMTGIRNTTHSLQCIIMSSSFSCFTPEAFLKGKSLGSSCPKTRNVKAVVHYSWELQIRIRL